MERTTQSVAINVVAAGFFLLGCGETRKVTHTPAAAGGDAGEAGGSANATGGSASGTGGRADAVGGDASARGGSKTAGPFGGAATWNPQACHVTPVPEPADATAKEQWSLARGFCLALKPECIPVSVVSGIQGCSAELAIEQCVTEVLWFHYQKVSAECEDAWRKDLQCGSQSSVTGAACDAINTSGPFGSNEKCAEENAALQDCMATHSTDVAVDGSYTTCWYSTAAAAASSCLVTCQLNEYWAALNCSGPPGLPKQCGCTVNGHVLTSENPLFVSDCADAAAQAADGMCTSQLDCCFEYGDLDKQACRCAFPAEFGYDSCEAMMAVADGRQVSICPELLPDSGGGCWPPGNCLP